MIFEKSIIVAAHPDDEVLWFSSILGDVDRVVICFLERDSNPARGKGRRASLLEHPSKNISCLGFNEIGAFHTADWDNPKMTRFGMELVKNDLLVGKYEENYFKLKKELYSKLNGYHNVFTHNPWGEYGHEEHVQIYRVVRELQEELKFNLLFSNYCSDNSFKLMLRYICGYNSDYVTLKTNKVMAETVMAIYKKHNCWTWYDDWEWFNEESFMKDTKHPDEVKPYGHIFPLNMIKFGPVVDEGKKSGSSSRKKSLRTLIVEGVKHILKHEKNP